MFGKTLYIKLKQIIIVYYNLTILPFLKNIYNITVYYKGFAKNGILVQF